jgi:hypothetical protein
MPKNLLYIENARMIFRNFSGKATAFNPPGKRTFCVLLDDPKVVEKLTADGWNVKHTKPRDEDSNPEPYIQVNVNTSGDYPPQIFLISSERKARLDDASLSILDWADIVNADVTISPYHYTYNKREGISAYLDRLYITIVEDALTKKYGALPEEDGH